jgi:predicted nucleic acid-binding protein
MKIYADTSALIAWFHPADEFAEAVTDWCRERTPEFSWNPILRMELRHNLRKLSGKYAAAAWHAYRGSEISRRLRMDSDRLSDVFERADELSARHAQGSRAGTWDVVHIAAAQRTKIEFFVTCDAAQAELASLSGIAHVHLFQ